MIPGFYRVTLTEILIWGLYALSFSLAYGYGGMVSFGQALFFGAGAYGLAYAFTVLTPLFLPALVFAVAVAAAFAAATGLLAVRLGRHHFIMITLLVSVLVLLFLASGDWRWLTAHIVGKRIRQQTVDFSFWSFPVANRALTYYLVLAVVAGAVAAVRRLVISPFGQALAAVRENELRSQLVGYNTFAIRLAAFTAAGALAGLAGALYALTAQYNFLDFFSWEMSARAVVWSIVGGARSVAGAFLGAAFVTLAVDLMSSYVGLHQVLVGLMLVAVVRVGSQGLVAVVPGLWPRRGRLPNPVGGRNRQGAGMIE